MVYRCFWLFFIASLLIGSSLEADDIPLKKIQPVPLMELQQPGNRSVVGEYHGRGVIDAVQENGVVINDSFFSLSDRTTIKYTDGRSFSGRLKPGTEIYYYLGNPKRIVAIFVEK